MTTKLREANLKRLESTVRVPAYDRRKVSASTVYIGVGGFHRAHQGVYTDDLLEFESEREWGLCGVGLPTHDARMRDVLLSQDCLYRAGFAISAE
jgi:mannitol 2-dehydrogenase